MLKVAVIILVIMFAYSGAYTLMAVIAPKVVAGGAFKSIAGKDIDSIQDAGYLSALLDRQRSIGVFSLTSVVAGAFILFVGFRKAQKWAWWAILFVGGIGYLWGLVHNIAIADKLNTTLMAIGLAMLLVGLLLPVKEFFTKPAEEA